MSSASQHRLFRAVRVLPEVVRIGQGAAEPPAPAEKEPSPSSAVSPETAELERLGARVRELESETSLLRERAKGLEAEMLQRQRHQEEERAAWLEQAQRETQEAREQALREAREEGFRQGNDEGRTVAEADLREAYQNRFEGLVALLEKVHGDLSASRERLLALQEPEMVRLWESLLSRMLFAQVTLDQRVLSRVLLEVLGRISDRERILVYLNPRDLKGVDSLRESLTDVLRGAKHVEFSGDEHVDPGSCLVETNLGVYDARWRTQLEQIASQVEHLLVEGAAEDDVPAGD